MSIFQKQYSLKKILMGLIFFLHNQYYLIRSQTRKYLIKPDSKAEKSLKFIRKYSLRIWQGFVIFTVFEAAIPTKGYLDSYWAGCFITYIGLNMPIAIACQVPLLLAEKLCHVPIFCPAEIMVGAFWLFMLVLLSKIQDKEDNNRFNLWIMFWKYGYENWLFFFLFWIGFIFLNLAIAYSEYALIFRKIYNFAFLLTYGSLLLAILSCYLRALFNPSTIVRFTSLWVLLGILISFSFTIIWVSGNYNTFNNIKVYLSPNGQYHVVTYQWKLGKRVAVFQHKQWEALPVIPYMFAEYKHFNFIQWEDNETMVFGRLNRRTFHMQYRTFRVTDYYKNPSFYENIQSLIRPSD